MAALVLDGKTLSKQMEIELAERVDRLLGRLQNVEQTLVRANFELLA